MNRHRILLAIRAIDVSYRSAIRHAPPAGSKRQEWLGHARQRAEQLLDGLESQLPHVEVDAEVSAQLRVVRDNIRRSDERAWGGATSGDDPSRHAPD